MPSNRKFRFCIACGCTWSTACPGGCAWVAADRCSQCADVKVTTPLTPIQAQGLREIYQRSANPLLGGIARGVMAAHIHGGRVSLHRAGRQLVWRMTARGRRFLGAHALPNMASTPDPVGKGTAPWPIF